MRSVTRPLAAAVIAVLPLVFVSGCIAPSNPPSGGVAGTVETPSNAGTASPVFTPVGARLSFIQPNGNITFTSSGVARGRFYVALAPGAYVLKVVGPHGCDFRRKIEVRSGKVIHLRLFCQTVG